MILFASLPINDADWVETRGRGSSFHIIPILTHLVHMQKCLVVICLYYNLPAAPIFTVVAD